MSRVKDGRIHVTNGIPSAQVEKHFPPRYDFTKESF